MRSKHLHDVDAGGVDKLVEKQLKRKGKELSVDDDFVDDSPKVKSLKKHKVSPSSSKPKKKKPSKKVPKLVKEKISIKVNTIYVSSLFCSLILVVKICCSSVNLVFKCFLAKCGIVLIL